MTGCVTLLVTWAVCRQEAKSSDSSGMLYILVFYTIKMLKYHYFSFEEVNIK